MIQYYEIPTIALPFSPEETSINPDNLVIPSLRFYKLMEVNQIFLKVVEGEDITKYCEPTPGKISLEMDNVGLYSVVPETGKRNRDHLKNRPY